MDPITHALVGLALGSLYHGSPALANPVYVGCVLGSIIPDGDIVLQTFGHYTYLKNHRGASHSIPGLVIMSLVVSGLARVIFHMNQWPLIFLWTLYGTLSHVFLDILNSYGAQLLWPISKQKYSLSLLMIFDPFVVVTFSGILIARHANYEGIWTSLMFLGVYLLFRIFMRVYANRVLHRKFREYIIQRIDILPSMYHLFRWDFIIRTCNSDISGSIDIFSHKIDIRAHLKKGESWLEDKIMNSKLGEFFKEFSPIYHVQYQIKEKAIKVTLIDLRYYLQDRYLHHATAVFNENMELMECFFHPYNPDTNVRIPV